MPITFEQYQQIYQKNLITEVQRQTLLGVRTALTDAAERAQNHIDQYGDKDERFSPKQQKAVNDLAQLFDKIDTLTSEPSKIKPEVWEQYVKSLEGAEKLIDSNDLMPGLKAIGVDPAPVFEGFRVLNETFGFEMPVDKWQQSYQAEKIAPEKAPQQHDNIIIEEDEEPNLNVIKEEPKYENGALAGNIVDFCRKANRDEADKLKFPLLDVVAETAYISDGLTKKKRPCSGAAHCGNGQVQGTVRGRRKSQEC